MLGRNLRITSTRNLTFIRDANVAVEQRSRFHEMLKFRGEMELYVGFVQLAPIVLKRFDEERSAGIIVTHSVTQKTIRAYVSVSTVAMLHKHKRSET